MARIENKHQKLVRKFREFVVGRMKSMKITQRVASSEMCMSQQTFSYKLSTLTFDVGELMELFKILEVEPEELSTLMLERK